MKTEYSENKVFPKGFWGQTGHCSDSQQIFEKILKVSWIDLLETTSLMRRQKNPWECPVFQYGGLKNEFSIMIVKFTRVILT